MQKRKSKYSDNKPEIIASVLAGMEAGTPFRRSCKEAGVAPPTFIRWCDEDPKLAEQYAISRMKLMDMIAEEIIEISDELPPMTANGSLDSAGVNHQRLRVDSRKWLLSKLAPKKYGERQTVDMNVKASLENLVTGDE